MPQAVYWNGFYPGHIGVPENTAYTVFCRDRETLLHVVGHRAAVVVTDFGNALQRGHDERPGSLRLSRSIPTDLTPMVSVDFAADAGQRAGICAFTRDHAYLLYREQYFTEITVGVEAAADEPLDDVPDDLFSQAMEQFVLMYRLFTFDVWVVPPGRLRANHPIVRRAAVRYREIGGSYRDRLVDHLPPRFDLRFVSFKEFARDIPTNTHDPLEAATTVGHYLAARTEIPQTMQALLDCAGLLTEEGRERLVVVEAFSIAELEAFDFVGQLRRRNSVLEEQLARRELRGHLTMRVLINSFLPHLLREQLTKFPDLIRLLDIARKSRDGVLHRGESVRREQAELAVNACRQLIRATTLARLAT